MVQYFLHKLLFSNKELKGKIHNFSEPYSYKEKCIDKTCKFQIWILSFRGFTCKIWHIVEIPSMVKYFFYFLGDSEFFPKAVHLLAEENWVSKNCILYILRSTSVKSEQNSAIKKQNIFRRVAHRNLLQIKHIFLMSSRATWVQAKWGCFYGMRDSGQHSLVGQLPFILEALKSSVTHSSASRSTFLNFETSKTPLAWPTNEFTYPNHVGNQCLCQRLPVKAQTGHCREKNGMIQ